MQTNSGELKQAEFRRLSLAQEFQLVRREIFENFIFEISAIDGITHTSN